MFNRKIFALSLLAAFALAGCAENNAQDTKEELCGNGYINTDVGEECDGINIGNAVCPSGTGTVTCNSQCKLVYTACTQTNKCGNGIIDVGEGCDGGVSANCPEGTTGTVLCTSCSLDYSQCKPTEVIQNCGNGVIDSGEECDGKVLPAGKEVCAEGSIGTPVCVNCKLAGCVEAPTAVCGNNTLETGEECDGTNLNSKTCADVKAGSEGTLKCTNCKLDASECTIPDTPADPTCGNNTLDANEECDGSLFATGKDACPAGTTGTVTCNASCKVDTSACSGSTDLCEDGEEKCSAAEENQSKCTSAGDYAMCISGCWVVEECSNTQTCDETKGCVTKSSEYTISKCDNNVYIFGDEKETISEDCTISGQICDDKNGCVANQKGITCDGTVLTITGTKYSYDCANNKNTSISADKAKLGCAENVGCTDTFCNNEIPTVCMNDGTCLEDYDCSLFNATCDMKIEGSCKTKSEASKCFVSNGTNIWSYCDTTGCLFDACVDACDDNNGCTQVATEKCGDGTLDNDEDCDWQSDGSGGTIYLWSYSKSQGNDPTCNFFDKTKVYTSGQATCKNKKGECKITVEECVEATDSDFKDVKSWKFTSLSYIANLTKTKEVTMKLRPITGSNDNQDISEYVSGAWRTGGWVKASNPSFDYYLWFHTGKEITDNAVRVTFDIKRTDKGPQYIMLQYFDDSKALGKSDSFKITENYQTASFVYKSKSKISNFGFKLTGYNGGDGLIDLKDVVVQSVNAI